MALRVNDIADSVDVIGDPSAAQLSRASPGRAVMRFGHERPVTFQAARCTAPGMLVDAIRAAWEGGGAAPPRRPWHAPLPELVDPGDLPVDAIGLLDDPDAQEVHPLRWDRRGNLLVAGAVGSGLTATLRSIAVASMAMPRPAHVYVVDARGDAQLGDLAPSRLCAAVVRLHERERLARMLRRLADEISSRAARAATGAGGARHDVVLIVDGLPSLRAALGEHEGTGDLELLQRVLADGPGHGVLAVLGTDQPTAVPASITSMCAERWVLRLSDPHDASWLGVPKDLVPTVTGRVIVASTGLEAQVAVPTSLPPPDVDGSTPAPSPIDELPTTVTARGLAPAVSFHGSDWLPMGIAFDALDTASIELIAGEHLAVLGPPRSGRSTTLRRIAARWLDLHPDGSIHAITPRRSTPLGDLEADPRWQGSLDELAGRGGPAMVAIDDAELVDDDRAQLGALLAQRRLDVTFAIAARPDALRHLYGHWSAAVRRSRCGVVMAGTDPIDGELLGTSLPRRLPIALRPGLAWLISAGDARLAQIAIDDRGPSAMTPTADRGQLQVVS